MIKFDQDDFIKKIGIELFSKVINKTPVDTGRLRSNWIPSFNSPNIEKTEFKKSGATVKGEVIGKMQSYNGENSIYLSNNLPYVNRIEYDSHSNQAPSGMVRISLIEIKSFINKNFKDFVKVVK